jgi:hypothetical protein
MPDIDRRALLGLLAGGAALTLRDRDRGDGVARTTTTTTDSTAATSGGGVATDQVINTMLTDKTDARSLGESYTNEADATRLFVVKFDDVEKPATGTELVRPQVRDESGAWVSLSVGVLDDGQTRSVSGLATAGSDYRAVRNDTDARLRGWWEAEL